MTTLCDLACDIRDRICGTGTPAAGGIDQLTEGVTGQVSEAVWDDLEPLIASSKNDLKIIFDPNQSPSLSPPDAGDDAEVDTSSWDTDKMGDELCDRATEAKNEICGISPDHEVAGTKLHEIDIILSDLKVQADPT